MLPLAAILGFLLFAILATIVGLHGAQLAADGLLNPLVLVGLLQGNMLLVLSFFAILCFGRSLWRSKTALWSVATDLFSKTPALMRLWRAIWTHPPTVPRLSTTHRVEYRYLAPARELTGAFTLGLTPQLE